MQSGPSQRPLWRRPNGIWAYYSKPKCNLGTPGYPFGDARIAFGPTIVSPNAIWASPLKGGPGNPGIVGLFL